MTTIEHTLLSTAASHAGLSIAGARLLHKHSTSVFLLPAESAVARISHHQRGLRARDAVRITRWLADRGVPVTEPLLDTAIDIDRATVTFWHYYPQPEGNQRPSLRALGEILRQLHQLPGPPFDLPIYTPLTSLIAELEHREQPLPQPDRQWLADRAAKLLNDYHALESHLGIGMVHGDAYIGNVMWGTDRMLLGDWDEVAYAPRELDLINTFQGTRFGLTETDLDAFISGYGWDPRAWTGFETLREMRDLHTLSAYLRRGRHGDLDALNVVAHRLPTLRRGDGTASWTTA
ncbi:phosphotransferase [Nocardia tengchongensis]